MRYRKKPIEIEAIKFDCSNAREVVSFCMKAAIGVEYSTEVDGEVVYAREIIVNPGIGQIKVGHGQYVVIENGRSLFVYDADVFEASHEAVQAARPNR